MSIILPNLKTVGGEGPKGAQVMLVGEAPGREEEQLRRPFIGQAGSLLTELMSTAGIIRTDCYITNVVKERPKDNNIKPFLDLSGKYVHESPAFNTYRQALIEEINEVNPNVIVAVGAVPLWTLCGERGITKWRGSVLECKLVPGRKVVPIIHPAGALRTYIWRHFISFDLNKVKWEMQFPELRRKKREYIIRPTMQECMEYLEACGQSRRFAFDIETTRTGKGYEVSCIAFSYDPSHAISIPFADGPKPYFIPPQELAIWRKIAEILEDPKVESVAHNATFDCTFLFQKYGIKTRNVQDTMVATAIIYPGGNTEKKDENQKEEQKGFPKSLAFCTSLYTDVPYYKDEGKESFNKGVATNNDTFWLYNAKDAVVALEIFGKQLKDLARLGNLEVYDQQRRLIEPLLFMTDRGVKMRPHAMLDASMNTEAELIALEREFREIVGYDINPRSTPQLVEYFYVKQREKPIHGKNGNISTEANALKRLAKRPKPAVAEAAKVLLKLRKLGKLNNTYYKMKLDADNRLRCSMNPVGTRFGRLSSRKTIYGTGANMQNQPPAMKRFMVPDTGYVVIDMDLSQAENRCVAYLGPDEKMIHAFEIGVDVHALTASLIFNHSVEDIIKWDKEETHLCPIGGGVYSYRFWGKKANHGLNYGLKASMFAYYYEIPKQEAEFICGKYHTSYPGVGQYHRRVQDQLSQHGRTLVNLLGRRIWLLDRWGEDLFKEGYSFIPQSTVADILNQRGVNYLYYNQDIFGPAEFLLQVHDSITWQAPISCGWLKIAEMVIALKRNLERPLEVHGRSFTIPADIKLRSRNFGEGVEIKGGHKWKPEWWDPKRFARVLEAAYNQSLEGRRNAT